MNSEIKFKKMSLNKGTLRRLEKRIFGESDVVVIPIMSSSAEAGAIRQEAKRQGKKTIGIPIEVAEKYDIKLWNLEDLQ